MFDTEDIMRQEFSERIANNILGIPDIEKTSFDGEVILVSVGNIGKDDFDLENEIKQRIGMFGFEMVDSEIGAKETYFYITTGDIEELYEKFVNNNEADIMQELSDKSALEKDPHKFYGVSRKDL